MADKPSGKVINWDDYSIHPSMYAPERPDHPRKRERLPRIEKKWAPIPLTWLANPGPFSAPARLLIALIYRSRRGQKPVELDAAIAAEACIPARDRSRCARELEQLGAVRIDRCGRRQFVVKVLWKI